MGFRSLRCLDYCLLIIFPLKNLLFSVENVSSFLHTSPFPLCVGEIKASFDPGVGEHEHEE